MAFDALEIALQIIRQLRPLIGKIAEHDRDLARQVRRSGPSIAQNLAEGRARGGRDRRFLYTVAAGSAAETDVALRIAIALGYIAEADEALVLLDRVKAMCWRLTH